MATMMHTIKAPDIARKLTLNVRIVGMKAWGLRMRLGAKLIDLGARITGCKVEIEIG